MKYVSAFLFVFAIIAILSPSASAIELIVTDDATPNARPGDASGNMGGRGNNPYGFLGAETVNPAGNYVENERILMKWDLTGVAGIAGDATVRLMLHRDRGRSIAAELYKIKANNAAWTENTLTPDTIDGSNGWNGGVMLSAETGNLTTSGLSSGTGMAAADDGYEGATAGDLTPLDTVNWTPGQEQGGGACADGECGGAFVTWTVPQSVVQGWINDSSSNAGLILIQGNETNNPGAFWVPYSKDGSNDFFQANMSEPTLIFDVPEPGSVFLLSLGVLCLVATRRRQRSR